MTKEGPLVNLLPNFKRPSPDVDVDFVPGQLWMLRSPPLPQHLSFVDKRYGLFSSDPFVFLVLDAKVVGYMLPTPRSEQITVLNLKVMTLEGRVGKLIIDESEWNFDGWLYED